MSDVHEFMILAFNEGVDEAEQGRTMHELDNRLSGYPGLISRECYRDDDGRWVEHVVWSSQADLEAAAGLDEDPAVAALFERIDGGSVSYLRGERVGVEALGGALAQ